MSTLLGELHYHTGAYVIMPNQVHVILKPLEGETLAKILKEIKGASARAINQHAGSTGTRLWT